VRRTLARLSAGIRSIYNDLQSLQSLVAARPVAADFCGIGRNISVSAVTVDRFDLDQSASLGCRRKRGEQTQAIGRSRGGRTTKIHALTDPLCRPVAFLLTPGQASDIIAAPDLLALAPGMTAVIADKAYDGDNLRAAIIGLGALPVIPNKSDRKNIHPFDATRYRDRNVIERMFCRLKDFRRIATRYDKLARNFLAAIMIAAMIAYWLN
jgi:transposase